MQKVRDSPITIKLFKSGAAVENLPLRSTPTCTQGQGPRSSSPRMSSRTSCPHLCAYECNLIQGFQKSLESNFLEIFVRQIDLVAIY